MLNVECDLPEVYLQPGEVYVARKPTLIRTILGSCVGVTFWSAPFAAGALCHALLPRCPQNADATWEFGNCYRFVDCAIRYLARQFDQLGAPRGEVQVKLFGGADVLPINPSHSSRPTVGRMNCAVAIEVLRQEGFLVTATSLGGTSGRSIRFHTGTGEVRLRWLTREVIQEIDEG